MSETPLWLRKGNLLVSIVVHRVWAHGRFDGHSDEVCPECPPHTQEILDAARKGKDDE